MTIDTGKILGQINLKGVAQYYRMLGPAQAKEAVVIDFLKQYEAKDPCGQVLIFFNRKKELFNFDSMIKAQKLKFSVGLFHGAMSEPEKREMVGKIRNRSFEVVLATNIMARGLDIRTITMVISMDPPSVGSESRPAPIDESTYVHRVGRTGRHSDKGVALSLLQEGAKVGSELERDLVAKVKKATGCDILEVKDFEAAFRAMKEAFENNQKE